MNASRLTALAAIIAVAWFPSEALAQRATTEVLVRRVDSLQTRIAQLEQRVAELEALLRAAPARGQGSTALPNPLDLAQWRRLREDMSMNQVRALLGEPETIDGGEVATWRFPGGGRVTFIFGKLNSWSEPRR